MWILLDLVGKDRVVTTWRGRWWQQERAFSSSSTGGSCWALSKQSPREHTTGRLLTGMKWPKCRRFKGSLINCSCQSCRLFWWAIEDESLELMTKGLCAKPGSMNSIWHSQRKPWSCREQSNIITVILSEIVFCIWSRVDSAFYSQIILHIIKVFSQKQNTYKWKQFVKRI